MSYSEFTLESVQIAFALTITERANLLDDTPLAESSEFLIDLTEYQLSNIDKILGILSLAFQ